MPKCPSCGNELVPPYRSVSILSYFFKNPPLFEWLSMQGVHKNRSTIICDKCQTKLNFTEKSFWHKDQPVEFEKLIDDEEVKNLASKRRIRYEVIIIGIIIGCVIFFRIVFLLRTQVIKFPNFVPKMCPNKVNML